MSHRPYTTTQTSQNRSTVKMQSMAHPNPSANVGFSTRQTLGSRSSKFGRKNPPHAALRTSSGARKPISSTRRGGQRSIPPPRNTKTTILQSIIPTSGMDSKTSRVHLSSTTKKKANTPTTGTGTLYSSSISKKLNSHSRLSSGSSTHTTKSTISNRTKQTIKLPTPHNRQGVSNPNMNKINTSGRRITPTRGGTIRRGRASTSSRGRGRGTMMREGTIQGRKGVPDGGQKPSLYDNLSHKTPLNHIIPGSKGRSPIIKRELKTRLLQVPPSKSTTTLATIKVEPQHGQPNTLNRMTTLNTTDPIPPIKDELKCIDLDSSADDEALLAYLQEFEQKPRQRDHLMGTSTVSRTVPLVPKVPSGGVKSATVVPIIQSNKRKIPPLSRKAAHTATTSKRQYVMNTTRNDTSPKLHSALPKIRPSLVSSTESKIQKDSVAQIVRDIPDSESIRRQQELEYANSRIKQLELKVESIERVGAQKDQMLEKTQKKMSSVVKEKIEMEKTLSAARRKEKELESEKIYLQLQQKELQIKTKRLEETLDKVKHGPVPTSSASPIPHPSSSVLSYSSSSSSSSFSLTKKPSSTMNKRQAQDVAADALAQASLKFYFEGKHTTHNKNFLVVRKLFYDKAGGLRYLLKGRANQLEPTTGVTTLYNSIQNMSGLQTTSRARGNLNTFYKRLIREDTEESTEEYMETSSTLENALEDNVGEILAQELFACLSQVINENSPCTRLLVPLYGFICRGDTATVKCALDVLNILVATSEDCRAALLSIEPRTTTEKHEHHYRESSSLLSQSTTTTSTTTASLMPSKLVSLESSGRHSLVSTQPPHLSETGTSLEGAHPLFGNPRIVVQSSHSRHSTKSLCGSPSTTTTVLNSVVPTTSTSRSPTIVKTLSLARDRCEFISPGSTFLVPGTVNNGKTSTSSGIERTLDLMLGIRQPPVSSLYENECVANLVSVLIKRLHNINDPTLTCSILKVFFMLSCNCPTDALKRFKPLFHLNVLRLLGKSHIIEQKELALDLLHSLLQSAYLFGQMCRASVSPGRSKHPTLILRVIKLLSSEQSGNPTRVWLLRKKAVLLLSFIAANYENGVPVLLRGEQGVKLISGLVLLLAADLEALADVDPRNAESTTGEGYKESKPTIHDQLVSTDHHFDSLRETLRLLELFAIHSGNGMKILVKPVRHLFGSTVCKLIEWAESCSFIDQNLGEIITQAEYLLSKTEVQANEDVTPPT